MPGAIETVANQCVDNISTAVYRLARLGAKKFFVVNSVDLSTLPYEIIYERTEAAKRFSIFLNKRLPYSMKYIENKINVSIALFDFPVVFNKIAENHQKYGIHELTKPCQRTWPEITPAAEKS